MKNVIIAFTRIIVVIAMFAFMLFATSNNANATTIQNAFDDSFDYYEYQNVRDSKNDYFNLRVTYDVCDAINKTNESRYFCKLHAYERAITIDA